MVGEFTPANYGGGGVKVNDNPQPNTWRTIGAYGGIQHVELEGLIDDYQIIVDKLIYKLQAKSARNKLKYRYYDGKNKLKDFGISTPPTLRDVETVVGWPQKAVDTLAVRSRFDGFSATSDDVQSQLNAIAERSRLSVKYRQAVQGELIHSCCFATVKLDGAGRARIDIYDAEHATAVWDDAAGRIAYGLTIEDTDQNGNVTAFDVLFPDCVIHAFEKSSSRFDWYAELHGMGLTPMGVFAYRPTLRRPFGVSRISRSVMSITDSAVRVALGGDISFQFAVSPQKYLLNVDKNPFEQMTKWEAYIGSIFSASNNDPDRVPQFGQLSQASMQQTVDYMRLLAARFAAETNIPLAQLGVSADSNPSSAEALYAATEPLIIEAEDLNDGARATLKDLACMALAAELDIAYDELTDEYRDFSASMRNPAMPSIVSQADAMIKVASVVPGFAGTDVFFEQLGFSEDIRRQAKQQIKEANSQQLLNSIFAASSQPSGGV